MMSIIWAFVLIAIFSIILFKSADLVISNIVKLARRLHISDFSIGFFVLGLATSTPELFVGINSALDKQPQLSLGNLIGASIVLLTLIIGLSALINREVHFIKTFELKDMLLISIIIISPGFFILDGLLSRIDGILLILIYILFYIVMNRRQTFAEHIKDLLAKHHNHLGSSIGKTLFGVAGLIISSKVIVEAARFMSLTLNLPLVMIGLFMLALGTNLPELTVMIESIKKHHNQISIGDFLGSACANAPILGMVALLYPITIDFPVKVYFSLAMLVMTMIIFNAFFIVDKKITRHEGTALIALYVFFLLAEVFLQNKFN